jgi:hypothetical protein
MMHLPVGWIASNLVQLSGTLNILAGPLPLRGEKTLALIIASGS